MTPLIAFAALLIERFVAYPPALQNAIGHPVQWMGSFIAWMDTRFNAPDDEPQERRRAGVLMLGLLLGAVFLISAALAAILRGVPLGWLVEALLAVPFLASRQLGEMVGDVADALDISLEAGRRAVGHIVGRDISALDEAEISRAAIETLAENASDGVIAPLFWLLVFGLPGIVVYKAINTADSMVGHLNETYRYFGWASARLDDLVNWVPARLTALLFATAAFFLDIAVPEDAWEAAREDAPLHKSPNAGWPEAALAGALGFSLGGPRAYGGQVVDLPEMGHGRRVLGPEDIRLALALYARAIWLALALAGLLALSAMAVF